MYKVIRLLDDLLDKLLALAFLLLLLLGVYFIYDTAYVYYHAAADRVSYVRPGSEEAAAARPLTEDYVAWLSLDDTGVDFPVMQGEDNSKYLNTNPYGEYSLSGSIFLDSRNAKDFSDSYSVVYGHHMSGYLMFGALDRFYDESFFEEHTRGTLQVGAREYPLQIFALIATDAGEEILFQPQGSEMVLALAKETSMYYREPTGEHILALTTCVDALTTTRTVVLCSIED